VWFVEAIGPPTTYYNVFGIAVSGSPGTPKDALCFSNFDSGYSTNTWILGQPIKMACSAAPDGTSGNRILSLNGGDYINYSPDSYPYVPTLNTVVIGPDTQQVNGSGSFGGDTYIAAIGIWATVQLNADALKTITTPLPSPAPDVWLDFTDNAAIAPTIPGCGPTATSCLTDTRASSHTCDFTNGNWITVANNIPCITDKGLLVEDFATNGLRNSAAVGAVPGAPGTLPTFWADPLPFQGLSRNVVGTGTENGIDYVDVRYSGTPAPGFTFNLRHEVNPAPPIAVSTGQTWTASVFATLVGGTLAGVPTVTIGYQGFDVSHAFKESQITPVTLATGALGLSRKTFSFNITNAATKEIFSQVSFTVTTGVPVDFTVRVGWPQLERANQTIGVFATSPIRTTNAAITRAGDVVKMTRAPAFGAGYTMYVAGVPYAAAQAPLTLYGPGGSVRAYLNLSAGTGQAWLSGSDIYASTNSWTALQPYKLAIAAQPDGVSANLGMSLNGGGYAPPSAVYVTAPIALDTVKIGLDEWDDSASGYITQIGIWPNARLPDDALIGLTR
jgi:hypothetical protein